MTLATIEIELDEQTAQAYIQAAPDAQKKLRALLNLWLREVEEPSFEFEPLMDQISDNAVSRGLTPEILETLLDDE